MTSIAGLSETSMVRFQLNQSHTHSNSQRFICDFKCTKAFKLDSNRSVLDLLAQSYHSAVVATLPRGGRPVDHQVGSTQFSQKERDCNYQFSVQSQRGLYHRTWFSVQTFSLKS